MRRIPVDVEATSYDIFLGRGLLQSGDAARELAFVVSGRRTLIITDRTVGRLYADRARQVALDAGADSCEVASFDGGEGDKRLGTVESLYHAAISFGLDRASAVLALGGGVVGDVAGFVAATLFRGVPFVQIPTSLLAMVDSSVGGKVGVDLDEGKNLVGAFYQPRLVVADLQVLQSLPAREIRCGLAEIVKYAVIMDPSLFAVLDSRRQDLVALDLSLYEEVVQRCCELKAEVVVEDERESGRRAILNYGHTFGHALEALGRYEALNHGEAVAVGMGMAADVAAVAGLGSAETVTRQDCLLRALGLPVRAVLPGTEPEDVLEAMYRDKKVRRGVLRLVLPSRIGDASLTEFTDEEALMNAIGGRLGEP